jgi:hypothetical protein
MKRYILPFFALALLVGLHFFYQEKNTTIMSETPQKNSDIKPDYQLGDDGDDQSKKVLNKSKPKAAFLMVPAKEISGSGLQNIALYEGAALRGDGEAAFMIYQVFAACELQAENPANGMTQIDCAGLTEEQIAQKLKYLKLSAEAGFLQAQLNYPNVASIPYSEPSHIAKNIKEFQQLKLDSMRYLRTAANVGNIEAMQQMGSAYKQGLITEQDRVRAYAYYHAVSSSGLLDSKTNNVILSRMRSDMTETEVQQATALGNSIFKQCCK